MRIDIAWSDNAIALLDNIYRFYSEKSQTAAIRLYNRLLDSAEPLRVFPQAPPVATGEGTMQLQTDESIIEELANEYHMSDKQKKIIEIYTFTDELIEIHAVWDCRQEGWRLQEMFK